MESMDDHGKIDRAVGHHDHKYPEKRSHSFKHRLARGLGVVVLIEAAALVGFYIQTQATAQANLKLMQTEREQSQESQRLRPEHQHLQAAITALRQNRLPEAIPLEFDRLIPVDRDYVKAIIFTLAGKGIEQYYEYKILLENTDLFSIHPQLDILFLDRRGIRVGWARMGVQNDGTPTLERLEHNESRTHSAHIEVDPGFQPEYFRLILH